MKQNLHSRLCILFAFTLFAIACKKSTDTPYSNQAPAGPHDTTLSVIPDPVVPYPSIPVQECNNAPNYGDSIVYPQPNSTGNYIYPQNNQGQAGTYLSWPGGLVMDSKTGIIDLSASQTGQRYSVGFVLNGSKDTCLAPLIVAGASYMDSVYVLSESDTSSTPYFNANPFAGSPCQGNSGPGCQFDYNDYARRQGVIINKRTGYIDLKNTTRRINFNTLINGEFMITRIYYKLNDNSNNAPQMIQLKLIYYVHKSDIPPDLLAKISSRSSSALNFQLLDNGPTPRPPLIIIVRAH